MQNILFFGNSLTAGYGLQSADTESFPALIQEKINAEGYSYTIRNAGLSGDTSSGGLQRLEYWMTEPIDVFVLELGINDLIRGILPDVTYENLDKIISKVKERYPDVKLALMGMELPSFIPGYIASEFRALFRKLADKHQMAYVPFFLEGVAGFKHLNLWDGIHPSAEGYRIVANKVWPVLRGLLTK
ncbi:arylesterase [Pseudoxanthomonas sp. SGD-10]|nr:arylesterase [Pseudoxanthomonas sp. SGD-10]